MLQRDFGAAQQRQVDAFRVRIDGAPAVIDQEAVVVEARRGDSLDVVVRLQRRGAGIKQQ